MMLTTIVDLVVIDS